MKSRVSQSLIILVLGGMVLMGVLLMNGGVSLAVLAGIAIFSLALLFISIELVLYLLLFFRPSLDAFGDVTISVARWLPALNLAGMVALVSIALSLGIILRSRKSIFRIPLFWPISLFFLTHLVFSIHSVDLGISINEVVRVGSFLIMYFAAYLIIQSREDFFRLIWVVILSGIIPATVAVVELITGRGLYTNPGFENRIAGTFGHPNVLGYFLLICISLLIYLFMAERIKGSAKQTLMVLYGIILSILLISTYTRGAWIGFALLVGGVSLIRWPQKTIWVGIFAIPSSIVLALIYVWIESNIILGLPRLEQIPIVDRIMGLFSGDPSDSILWRQQIWADMYQKGWERPLQGFGTGTIELVTESVRGLGLGALEVHNDYVKVFVEMGLVGFFMFIFLISATSFSLLSYIKSRRDLLAITSLFLVLAVFLSSLWDNLLRQTAVMWIFFALLGAVFKYKTEISNNVSQH